MMLIPLRILTLSGSAPSPDAVILSVEAHRAAATASVTTSARRCFIGHRLIRSALARRCKPPRLTILTPLRAGGLRPAVPHPVPHVVPGRLRNATEKHG